MNIYEAVKKVDSGEALAFRQKIWLHGSGREFGEKHWIVIYGFGFRWLHNGELTPFEGTIGFLENDWEVIAEDSEEGLEVSRQRKILFEKLTNELSGPRRVNSMYRSDPIVHEDEIILSYLNSFAYTIKLWVDSHQEIRILQTVDKFSCIITAYIHGIKDSLISQSKKELSKNKEA